MVTPQLKEYAQNQLASGMTEDALSSTLAIQGWAQNDIDEVFSAAPGSAAGSLLSQMIESPTPDASPTTTPVAPAAATPVAHSKLTTMIAVSALALLIVGGGFYAYARTKKVAAVAPTPSPSAVAIASATPTPTPTPTPSATPTATKAAATTPDPITADWKTYTVASNGASKGYTFKYPATGFNISGVKSADNTTTASISITDESKRYAILGKDGNVSRLDEPLYFRYDPDNYGGSFDKFAAAAVNSHMTKKAYPNVGGLTAYEFFDTPSSSATMLTDEVIVFKDGVNYQFNNHANEIQYVFGFTQADHDAINKLFNEVMSTVVFK